MTASTHPTASNVSANADARSPADLAGQSALDALAPKLGAIPDDAVVRPSTDPQGAATTALLVADYLGQAELREKLDGAATSADAVQELQGLARAIITVVARLGGDYLPDGPSIPGDLVQRGQGLRTTTATALEHAMPNDPDLQVWLEAIRLGSGVVDLVYDLRTLAGLCTLHGKSSAAVSDATAAAVPMAHSAADAIEFALRTGDAPSVAQARNTLARLWTLFVPAYDLAVAAARTLTRGEGRERQFPALALVASHRRAQRRPLSVMPSDASARGSLSPRRSGRPSAVPAAAKRAPGSASIPAAAVLPQLDNVALIEAEDVKPTQVERPAPPLPAAARPVTVAPAEAALPATPLAAATPVADAKTTPVAPATAVADAATPVAPNVAGAPLPVEPAATPATPSADREDWSDTRRASRHTLEMEVGIASQSNFYLGFTENLSSGGVFVATYMSKPIGSQVEVKLSFPNGEELNVPGVVRWLREATNDCWPGMGVQFESLSPADEAKVRKFLSLRDPMFYDDE